MSAEVLSTADAPRPAAHTAKPRRRVGYDYPAPKVPYGKIALRVCGIPLGIGAVFLIQQAVTGHFHPPAPHWPDFALIGQSSLVLKIHLASIAGALILGLVLLSGIKGRTTHKVLGWIWSVFMIGTAITTLFIAASPGLPHVGRFGLLHLFSVLVLVTAPLALYRARKGRWAAHGTGMTTIFFGALATAGIFAFFPGRLLYQVVFG